MPSPFRLSIGANIALTGLLAVLLWRDYAAGRFRFVARAPSAVGGSERSNTTASVDALKPKSHVTTSTRAAFAQLERMGISRDGLVNVLLDDLNRRATDRIASLQRKYAPRLVPNREMLELSRQNEAEEIRELKEALGDGGYRAWEKEQTLHELNRARAPGDELPMTADEAEQAYRLQKEFDQNARDLQMAAQDGVADQADSGTLLAQAQQALDRELEKLLGQQRFDALRGNSAPTTEVYRKFGDLNPTPDQAQAALQAEVDYRAREAALTAQQTKNPGDAATIAAELKAMANAREETYRQVFGAEAYDNYKLAHDSTYQALKQYAGAWNQNGDEARQVYHSVSAFQQQADAIRAAAALNQQSGQNVDWNAVNATIEQARQQTETGLQSTIGPERVRRLEQNGLLENGGASG
jgi:hypothetical protein